MYVEISHFILFVKSSPSVNLKCIFQAYLVSKFCNPGMFYFEDIWYSEAQGKFSNCQSNLFCQQSECNFSNFTVLHSMFERVFTSKRISNSLSKKITSLQTQKICGCAHNSTSWFPSCNWIYKISKQFFPSFPLLTSYPFLLWYLLLLCVYVVGPTPSTTVVADSPDSIWIPEEHCSFRQGQNSVNCTTPAIFLHHWVQ